jgi:hypothetical protein
MKLPSVAAPVSILVEVIIKMAALKGFCEG